MKNYLIGAVVFFLWGFVEAKAFDTDAPLDDPILEERARELAKEIRCLVCQNQSVFDSDADLAKDLRVLVRERVGAGDSDLSVKQFLVERYGDFILLKPPIKPQTYLLWFGPLIITLCAFIFIVFWLRGVSRERPELSEFSAAERRRIEDLIKDEEGGV